MKLLMKKPTKNLGAILLAMSAVASAKASDNFQLILSSSNSTFSYTGTPGKYIGQTLNISVATDIPQWRLYVATDPVTGPNGAIATSAFSLQSSQRDGTSSIATFGPNSTKLTEQKVFATGYAIPAATKLGTLRISAELPALTKPGNVSGALHFYYQNVTVPGSPIVPAGNLAYTVNVQSYTTVELGSETLDFTAENFGSLLSNSNLSVTVTTNNPAGSQVSVTFGQLSKGSVLFPKERTCVAIAIPGSPELNNLSTLPLGTGALSPVSLTSPYGSVKYYVRARIFTTPLDRPGIYAGNLMITTVDP